MEFVILFVLLPLLAIPPNVASPITFSTNLIHHNSPASPSYNKSLTPRDLLRLDTMRVSALHAPSSTNVIGSKIFPGPLGTYLMKVGIGSPPVENFYILDTGSDLIWTQCFPCEQCYFQAFPHFEPSKSTTYKNISCDSSACNTITHKCDNQSSCQYSYKYGDESITMGIMAYDTLSLISENDQVVSLANIVFGCGNIDSGYYHSQAAGIVGLGRGFLSMMSQLGLGVADRFSYCLVPTMKNSSSRLQIWKDTSTSKNRGVSTPILPKKLSPTNYYVVLEGLSIGGKKLVYKTSVPDEGNIIIDSGTSLNYLKPELCEYVESMVRDSINLEPLEDPLGMYKLCYNEISFNNIPEVSLTFHFRGADVVLKKINMFIRVDDKMTCFTMIPTKNGPNIYGNIAQMDFQIEFDLRRQQISFVATDCASHHEEAKKGTGGHLQISYFLVLLLVLSHVI